jgi:hypothetical protein
MRQRYNNFCVPLGCVPRTLQLQYTCFVKTRQSLTPTCLLLFFTATEEISGKDVTDEIFFG